MKKILLFILISSYSLFADALPTSIKSSVKSLSNGIIQLSSNVPTGMSGIIIHNYGNGLSAISHSTVSLGNGKATVEPHTAILHKNIPSIQTEVTVGDHVIFGNFYNNALVIAPNQVAYQQITKKFKRTWVHPDAFALHFMQEAETTINMNILEQFAKKNQVGLVLVVSSDKLLIIDPISKKIIGSTGLKTNPNTAIIPFYARFKQMDLSVFAIGDNKKNYTPYFQSVAGLK
jgi:co-chaperonin GroES (HSP10)